MSKYLYVRKEGYSRTPYTVLAPLFAAFQEKGLQTVTVKPAVCR